jgi:hypothetical protein
VHEARAPDRLPVNGLGREPSEGRIATVVQHADRPRRRAELEEIDADPGRVDHTHVLAVDAVAGQLPPDPLAPGVGGHGRDPRRPQAEARAGGNDVGLGAADLHVELAHRLDAPRRGNGEPQHHLADGDEVVHLP